MKRSVWPLSLVVMLMALPAQAQFERPQAAFETLAKQYGVRWPVLRQHETSKQIIHLDWAAPKNGWTIAQLLNLQRDLAGQRTLLKTWVQGNVHHFVYRQGTDQVLHIRALKRHEHIIDVIAFFDKSDS